MPDAEDITSPASQLWSKKKIALIFFGPPTALVLALLIYLLTSDEKLQSFPELASTPQLMPGPDVNGFTFLLTQWGHIPHISPKFRWEWNDFERGTTPWQDSLVEILNPHHQDFRKELAEALSRPVWRDPGELTLGPEKSSISRYWEVDVLLPLKAEGWRRALAGNLDPAVSLIANIRRMASGLFLNG